MYSEWKDRFIYTLLSIMPVNMDFLKMKLYRILFCMFIVAKLLKYIFTIREDQFIQTNNNKKLNKTKTRTKNHASSIH